MSKKKAKQEGLIQHVKQNLATESAECTSSENTTEDAPGFPFCICTCISRSYLQSSGEMVPLAEHLWSCNCLKAFWNLLNCFFMFFVSLHPPQQSLRARPQEGAWVGPQTPRRHPDCWQRDAVWPEYRRSRRRDSGRRRRGECSSYTAVHWTQMFLVCSVSIWTCETLDLWFLFFLTIAEHLMDIRSSFTHSSIVAVSTVQNTAFCSSSDEEN